MKIILEPGDPIHMGYGEYFQDVLNIQKVDEQTREVVLEDGTVVPFQYIGLCIQVDEQAPQGLGRIGDALPFEHEYGISFYLVIKG